jgi:hypothetical protein
MIENISKATGSPIEIELADKNKYKLSPLTIGDIGDFPQWIHVQKIKLLDSIGYASQDEKIATHLKILNTPITEEEYSQANASINGIRHLIFLSLKHNHNITEEKMNDLVTLDNMSYVLEMINSIGKVEEIKVPLALTAEKDA